MVKITRGYGLLETFLARKRIKLANKLIPKKARQGNILDIGCGSYPYFLSRTEFKNKYGLDQTSSNEVYGNIKIMEFHLEKSNRIPFINEFFDVVTMLAVIEHLDKSTAKRILREIDRVLKPNGILIITTPCTWTDKLLRFMAKWYLVSAKEMEEHKEIYNHKKLINCLANSGFKNSIVKLGYFEFYLNNWVRVMK